MQLLAELARGAYESIRETLPSDTREAEPFLGGLLIGFALNWLMFVVLAWGGGR